MAIGFTNLGASAAPDVASTANTTTYATASWTPPTSGLLVAFVVVSDTVRPGDGATLTGNGITWTRIAQDGSGTGRKLFLFGANAAGSSAGATTFTPTESSTGCAMSFFHVTGADEANGVVQCFVQSPTAQGTGTTGTVNLAAAGHADNRPISGWAHVINEVVTFRANWTELDDLGYNTPTYRLETQCRSDAFETTATATWATSSAWNGIAAEIKAAVVADSSLKVTWAELETANAPRSAKVTWAELEAPTAPRSTKVTWAELEAPDAPRAAFVTWAELEIADAPRAAFVTWAELETTDAPRSALVTWAELETTDAPRAAIATWGELEVPESSHRNARGFVISTDGATEYTAGGATPAAAELLLAWVTTTDTATPSEVTPSGWGLTWAVEATILNGAGTRRTTLCSATTTSAPGAGAFVASVAAGTGNQSGCIINVVGYTDPSGIAPTLEQAVTDLATGNPSVSTLAALGPASWVEAEFTQSARQLPDATPDAGWDEWFDGGYITPDMGMWHIYSPDFTADNTPSGTWASSGFIAVAAEIAAPDRGVQVTWAELETPDAPVGVDRAAYVTWAELEVATAPRSVYVSWAELELADAPRALFVSWAELEAPDVVSNDRAAYVLWAELEIPGVERGVVITWAELETGIARYHEGFVVSQGSMGMPRTGLNPKRRRNPW